MIRNPGNEEYIELIVPNNKVKERIDKYLSREIGKSLSRSRIQQLIDAGEVLIDGNVVKQSYKILPGEVIKIHVTHPQPPDAKPEDIPIEIVFEDKHFLVVNKKPGMVVHPAFGNITGTLVNALMFHCRSLSKVDNMRPGIVHRLDKNTSGLIVVAKNDIIHRKLALQFYNRQVEKIYIGIVWGIFKNNTGTINAPIGRSKRDRKKMAIVEDGKPSLTKYHVIKKYDYLSLISLQLETGRTHQIRVHLLSIGHPIFGDDTYNGRIHPLGQLNNTQRSEAAQLLKQMARQALHAKTLKFSHPVTEKIVEFESDLPDDMRNIIKILDNKTK